MIINKTTGEELEKIGERYQYDFGARKLNTRVAVTLQVKGENVKNLRVRPDCQCTSTTPKVIDETTTEIDVVYKASNSIHIIKREIFIDYSDNGVGKSEIIKVTGQIIK